MILLFTDFGFQGPYVGQMHAAIRAIAPPLPVIDLMHDAPAFAPRASACLLAALASEWPVGAVVAAVVDPGVGSPRLPLAVRAAGRWLVGPDNGLLVPAARALDPAPAWYRIAWQPSRLSASFHGRDLFAPTAARIANGDTGGLAPLETLPAGAGWPAEEAAVVYIDGYGNVMTGLQPRPGAVLVARNRRFDERRTFADAARGEAFWYKNALGLAEIAINQGHAASRLGLALGDAVSWA